MNVIVKGVTSAMPPLGYEVMVPPNPGTCTSGELLDEEDDVNHNGDDEEDEGDGDVVDEAETDGDDEEDGDDLPLEAKLVPDDDT